MMFGLVGGTNMRGLNEFISDIRECKDKQSETKRVELELAKIRQKFTTEKGLNAYQRKKYVWKLLYIHILGYEVDFGFQEASGLINSSKYDQKYTGYVASSLLISDDNDQIWKNIVYSIESDIKSKNEAAQSLALSLIATIVPNVLIANLSDAIIDLAISNRSSTAVRKKAVMCLSRMIKKQPNKYDIKKFIGPLSEMFESRNANSLSFLNGAASLLLTVMNVTNPDSLKDIQPKVARTLHKLALNKEAPMNYLYYTVPNPWLQMKLYKSLQIWSPPEEKGVLDLIEEILTKTLKKTDVSPSINKSNIEYGLLFEVINVIIHYDTKIDKKLIQNVSKILVIFISSQSGSKANTRYLGLEAMCRLAVKHNMAEHLQKILPNLDDKDVSIRKRALDLLYLICNKTNCSIIVAQLLGYLENRVDPLIRDQLILKIAILAEKFAENSIWYVDVVVKLIQNAEIQNDIWYRIIEIITGFGQPNLELQNYAAIKLFYALSLPHVTDTLMCVGSYIVSEFSDQIVKSGKEPKKIFEAINKHFSTANNKSKAMMLNAFAKLSVKYESLREEIQMICHLCSQHWDTDVQQRGVELLALFNEDQNTQKKVIAQNPVFNEEQQLQNPLLVKLGALKKNLQTQKPAITKSSASTTQPQQNTPNPAAFQTMSNPNTATSHPLANHPFFKQAIDRLCPNLVNLIGNPGRWQLKPYWKEAFAKKNAFDGCQMKDKLEDQTLKVILAISIQTAQMQFKIFRNKGFDVTNSPIKYGAQNQQIMLTFTPNGQKIEPPTVGIAWKDGSGQIAKKQVQLPITISKFLNPVDISYEKFNTFYKDYSLANNKFHKLDSFLKIPEGVKGSDYLKKVGAFLGSVCNFKSTAYPSPTDIKLVFASATLPLKEEGKIVNYPILIQVEAYESDKGSAARVGLRGGNGNSLVSVFQLMLVYF